MQGLFLGKLCPGGECSKQVWLTRKREDCSSQSRLCLLIRQDFQCPMATLGKVPECFPNNPYSGEFSNHNLVLK